MKANLCFTMCTALALAACATSTPIQRSTITMAQIKSADYGAYPKNYEQRIRQDLENRLLDYDSAKIKIIVPPKKTYEVAQSDGGNPAWRTKIYYSVCVNVNAKNSYGAYTGWQTHRYKFWNNQQEYESYGSLECDKLLATNDEIYIDNWAKKFVEIVQ